MSYSRVRIGGVEHTLGNRIGKGGEGEIFCVNENSTIAVKIYLKSGDALRQEKVKAMISGAYAKKSPLIAFPINEVLDQNGKFVGFSMNLVKEHRALHDLYAPGARKQNFPNADYRFLVRTAANIARAFASVHHSGCVIGDVNHSSILISKSATAMLIDADSFQVSSGGRTLLSLVGVPEYTPPELQGKKFSEVVRTPNHDCFGLAVVLFQILIMGRQPFVGTVRKGEIPPLHENIRHFRYPYSDSRDVGMDQPPGTPSISDFYKPIAEFFETSFSQRGTVARPQAVDWVRALETLERSLVRCESNPLHYIPKEAGECAWCEMESTLGTILFIPSFSSDTFTNPVDPGEAAFSLDKLWNQIESIKIPELGDPKFSGVKCQPSARAVSAKPVTTESFRALWLSIVSIALLVAFPAGFIIWVPLIIFGITKESNTTTFDEEVFKRSFIEATHKFEQEVFSWRRRVGIEELRRLREELFSLRIKYRDVQLSEGPRIDEYRKGRKAKQLSDFLDSFDIAKAKIKGIGPAKLAALSSYGIDTALNVTYQRVLAVPGFGPENSKPLLAWRDSIEAKFTYQQGETDFDRREIQRIKTEVRQKLAEIRPQLLSGPSRLSQLSARVSSLINISDGSLRRAFEDVEQAKTDLQFLGVALPVVNKRIVNSNQPAQKATPTVAKAPGVTSPTSSSTRVVCPRCQSPMAQRRAKRGANAGSYFWGCSRYPTCKGTRSI